jgi:hypothetical protein
LRAVLAHCVGVVDDVVQVDLARLTVFAGPGNPPGRAALISTVILLSTYLIVAIAIQAFAGFGDTGIGLANEETPTTSSRSSASRYSASLGLAVAFYYGITAFSCVWYFRKTLFTSARHFFMRGLLPLLGGIGMAAAFIKSAIDMVDPDYGFATFGPIGGVFVSGVGMLALGVPLMIACAVRLRAFFRGETLNEETPILVPDTGDLPAALSE